MKVLANKPFSYESEKFQATRPLDYIYDPLFTFSGPKDYNRTANESYQTSCEFMVQPIFDSMFSDMVRYPRASLVLRPAHQVPQSIDTSYKGKIKATEQERTVTSEVAGVDRYKYFRRPVTETHTEPTPGPGSRTLLGLENVTQLGMMAPPATAEKVRERSGRLSAATQVRGVQTDYRETEAQTLPWTPPYTVRGRHTPEVLQLDQLSWGNGLPPGRHEVEIVERMRMKQAWEARLPPLDTVSNIKKRHKLISEMEKSDWNFRNQEIQAIHDERLKKSNKLLEQHVLLNRTRLSYRMEFLEDDINKRKERTLQLTRHNKERALRKICMKEKGYNPKRHRKGVVAERSQHTSQLYAPMKRLGTSFVNRHEVLAEKHVVINSSDVSALESATTFRPVFDFEKASQPKRQTELCVRETRWTMENLAKLHADLQTLHAKQQKKPSPFFSSAVEILPKPDEAHEIISVPLPDETNEDLYQASILIQRVIEGRAIQTLMHHGRARWKEVIEELRSAKDMSIQQLNAIHKQKSRTHNETRLYGVVKDIIGQNVGWTIGQTLDHLAVELLRFRGEGVAHSLALEAECARWRREVPEAGRRQREFRRRHEHDLMFSQLLEVYQQSINEFMEVLVTRAREHEAKTEAYEYAKEMAILAKLKEAEEEEIDTEPISADLLFALVAPDGLRELTRACMLILKQKYDEARQRLVNTGKAEPLQQPVEEILPRPSATELVSIFTTNTYSYATTEGGEDMARSSIGTTEEERSRPQSPVVECPDDVARFGIAPPTTAEQRLLSKIMRDMCYVAGRLLQTAAKILNKALQLSCIPQDIFEEALRRTMQVINGARDEIVRIICPKQPEKFLLPSEKAPAEIILEATQIVDSILLTAKERIAVVREKYPGNMADQKIPRIVFESDIHVEAKEIVAEVIDEAYRKVVQTIVLDFLTDLISQAENEADLRSEDVNSVNIVL